MSNSKFEFKQDSLTKLVMFQKGATKPELLYSFDGRKTKTGRIRIWDDAKFQNDFDKGVEYLKEMFSKKYSAGDYQSVYIATRDYNKHGGTMICRHVNGSWTTDVTTPVAPVVLPTEQYFMCKLWLPLEKSNITFYTKDYFPLEDLRFQYQKWREANPKAIIKGFGTLYGNLDGELHLPSEKNIKRIYSYYFDWKSENFYHNQTRRVAGVNEF
jgi:hypothetical protein